MQYICMPTFATHGSHCVGVGCLFSSFQVHREDLSGREKNLFLRCDGADTDRAALYLVGPCGLAIYVTYASASGPNVYRDENPRAPISHSAIPSGMLG